MKVTVSVSVTMDYLKGPLSLDRGPFQSESNNYSGEDTLQFGKEASNSPDPC